MLIFLALLVRFTAFSENTCKCAYEHGALHDYQQNNTNDIDYLYKASSNLYAEMLIARYIGKRDRRTGGYLEILSQMIKRNLKVIVETGTIRNGINECIDDGCSTLVFGSFAWMTQKRLYSIDNSKENVMKATTLLEDYQEFVEIVQADPISFLGNFDKGLIDVLYLDASNYEIKKSKEFQELYIKELKAAYHKLHKKSIIAIDDCQISAEANCRLVKDFLEGEGWKMIKSGYIQVYSFI